MVSDTEDYPRPPVGRGCDPGQLWRVSTVDLHRVDQEDETYRITTDTDVNHLIPSIQRLGLLIPPLLASNGKRFAVVSGFRRLESCRRIGIRMIPARVTLSHAGHRERIQCAISENILQRELNPVEISRSLALLDSAGMGRKQLQEAAGRLGLPSNENMIRKLIPICRMPDSIQSAILSGAVSLPVAEELARREPGIALQLAELLLRLNVSLNKQREIILLLDEIARREDRSIPDVLGGREVTSILNSSDLDRNQLAAALRRYLRIRRYPSIARAQKRFETELRQLQLGRHMQLKPPREFEGTTYTLSLTFDNQNELARLLSRLPAVARHPGMGRILERRIDEEPAPDGAEE